MSLDTREPKRDEHLKSPDFLDVAKYPTMTFKSKKIEIIPASFKETMALGCNVVTLGGDRVLSTESAKDLNAKMRAAGFTVYDPDMSMFLQAGGGVHCMCQPLSREAAFLVNNWILLFSALFVLFATLFPTITEAINGERLTVGPPFFNRVAGPQFAGLVLLMGIAPMVAWRQASARQLGTRPL